MRNLEKAGLVLLGVWLIAQGLKEVVSFTFPYQSYVMAALAVLAGLLVIFGGRRSK